MANGVYTPQAQIDRKRALADSLRNAPRRGAHWGHGLAGIIDAITANRRESQARQLEKDNEALRTSELQMVLQGGPQGPTRPNEPAYKYQHPEVLAALLGQQNRMAQIEATNNRFTSGSGNRQFAGDPILDSSQQNRIVGYAQTNQGGAPITYGLDGQPLEMTPDMYVMPSASMAQYTPRVLAESTGQQAETAGTIEGAEQEAMTAGDAARTQTRADIEVDTANRLANDEYQRQLEQDKNRRQALIDESEDKLGQMNTWIDDAMENAGFWTTGFFGTMLEFVPGTPAYDLVATVDSIKSNVTFDKLQDMREKSPTGGALGQVSNFENQLMAATLGNLENSQSQEQFVENLNTLKSLLDQIVNRGISSFERDYGAPQSDDDIFSQADAILNAN